MIVAAIDPGTTSGIGVVGKSYHQAKHFRNIEQSWMAEATRAALVRPLLPFVGSPNDRPPWYVIIEDGGGFMSRSAEHVFIRSQCRWDGALRLLGIVPVYANVATWHAALGIRDKVRRIAEERENAGLPKLKRGAMVKNAVARTLSEALGYVTTNHNEADALAIALAVHSGLTSGQLAVGGTDGRRSIILSPEHRSRARRTRKRAAGK